MLTLHWLGELQKAREDIEVILGCTSSREAGNTIKIAL